MPLRGGHHLRASGRRVLAVSDLRTRARGLESPVLPFLAGTRGVHNGHVRKTLDRIGLPRHQFLKEVDQAPDSSSVRLQKDRYLRELGLAHGEIQGLFRDDERAQKAVLPTSKAELERRAGSEQRREDVTEAMRVYRMLRPDASPFYEEDAKLAMQSKMNRLLSEDEQALVPEKSKYGDPFMANLPVVNQRAFLIALESITSSLADDLETVCQLLGISQEAMPSENDPLRFKKLVDILFAAFPLKRDPSEVRQFMEDYWETLRLLLPEAIANLPPDEVANWLRGHLHRVRLNKRRNDPKIFLHKAESFQDDEYYNFAEDFPYDDDPMPGLLADERNLDFPLEDAENYMEAFLSFLSDSSIAKMASEELSQAETDGGLEPETNVAAQFQDLVWDLEKVGLRNWLRTDIRELERCLPKGALQEMSVNNPDDCDVAWLMLKCAARGRANLLDFEKVDPYKLLHGLPAREIEEELAMLPPSKSLSDQQLGELVENYVDRVRKRASPAPATDAAWLAHGAGVQDIYKRELDFYRTAGPAEWFLTENKDGHAWRWRQPPNTFWDERRKVYIPQQRGVSPNLDLKEMRQHLLEMRRMGSMCKAGRLYYYRAIIVVGNGRGVYGFGIGFANTPKEARTDASLKALQNLDYIDFDPGKMMTFPVKGKEYKQEFKIIPRPVGRGIKANKRFMPLLYILGLDNCKVSFYNCQTWFTRVRAIKRALDAIMSRRTLSNMTGKRHAALIAPGDHWVHWPDRWFARTSDSYHARARHAKLVRRHTLCGKKRGNRIVTPKELKPGWSHSSWARWNNPLERWIQQRRALAPTTWDPGTQPGSSDNAIPGATPPKLAGELDSDTQLLKELTNNASQSQPPQQLSEGERDTSLADELKG